MPGKQQGQTLQRTPVTRPRHSSFLLVAAAFALAAVFGTPPSHAQRADGGDWIETWTASPQPVWDPEFFAPINIPRSLRNQTVRQIAAVSIGGKKVRVVLSNEYGSKPLVIGGAHIALAGSGAAIVPGSDRALSFDGHPSVTIPPGAPVISDPVDLTVEPLSNVAVSLFLPKITPLTTFHWEGVVTIVACVFWLGALSTTVANTSQKLDKLNDGVVGISRDSLSNRLIAIETKLDIIDRRLESGAARPQKKPGSAAFSRAVSSISQTRSVTPEAIAEGPFGARRLIIALPGARLRQS